MTPTKNPHLSWSLPWFFPGTLQVFGVIPLGADVVRPYSHDVS